MTEPKMPKLATYEWAITKIDNISRDDLLATVVDVASERGVLHDFGPHYWLYVRCSPDDARNIVAEAVRRREDERKKRKAEHHASK
jgi:hypothetical protein